MNIGDVVKLNSGGPFMTITRIDAVDNELTCTWFVQTTGPFQSTFPQSTVISREELVAKKALVDAEAEAVAGNSDSPWR